MATPKPYIHILAWKADSPKAIFNTTTEGSEKMMRALVHAWENGASYALVRFLPPADKTEPAPRPQAPQRQPQPRPAQRRQQPQRPRAQQPPNGGRPMPDARDADHGGLFRRMNTQLQVRMTAGQAIVAVAALEALLERADLPAPAAVVVGMAKANIEREIKTQIVSIGPRTWWDTIRSTLVNTEGAPDASQAGPDRGHPGPGG